MYTKKGASSSNVIGGELFHYKLCIFFSQLSKLIIQLWES